MPSKAVEKKEYPSRYDMSVIRAFAGAVSSAYADYRLDICDFLHKAMKTNLFKNFEEEFTVHSQGAHCIAGKILEEINESVKAAVHDEYFSGDIPVAYWMGYVFMYWKLINSKDIELFSNINLENVYWSYDALHTADVS